MKIIPILKILSAVFAILAALNLISAQQGPPNARPEATVLTENTSLSAVLFDLAAANWEKDTKDGQLKILTLHDWSDEQEILKFTDTRYMVISIPILSDGDLLGFCRYAASYNAFTMKAADEKVKAGNYKQARQIYELLKHFDCCDVLKARLDPRLECLTRLEKGENVVDNLERFSKLFDNLGSLTGLSKADQIPPKLVTNLLDVAVKRMNGTSFAH
jgi:hypothetical protein